jgi:hypothetical protein
MKRYGVLRTVNKELIYVFSIFVFFICGFIITTDLPILLYSQNQVDPRSLTGLFDTRNIEGVFYGARVSSQGVNGTLLAYNALAKSQQAKHIEVDLASQQLSAFEGTEKVFSFPVSSGRWRRTPVGRFTIWGKLRYAHMSGGNIYLGTYYYLPNVPYAMYLSNDSYPVSSGYSINGSYWHKDFGRPVSHGSIDMSVDDAEKLFYWIDPIVDNRPLSQATPQNPGTSVVIYGTAP